MQRVIFSFENSSPMARHFKKKVILLPLVVVIFYSPPKLAKRITLAARRIKLRDFLMGSLANRVSYKRFNYSATALVAGALVAGAAVPVAESAGAAVDAAVVPLGLRLIPSPPLFAVPAPCAR